MCLWHYLLLCVEMWSVRKKRLTDSTAFFRIKIFNGFLFPLCVIKSSGGSTPRVANAGNNYVGTVNHPLVAAYNSILFWYVFQWRIYCFVKSVFEYCNTLKKLPVDIWQNKAVADIWVTPPATHERILRQSNQSCRSRHYSKLSFRCLLRIFQLAPSAVLRRRCSQQNFCVRRML